MNVLRSRSFWPLFWTQFFGAMNDNVFKNAIVILIMFKSFTLLGFDSNSMVALCGGIFILPFFLFSAVAGQIADRFSKSNLIFYIKIWEVLVMTVGVFGFLYENLYLLISTLFFMGLQSTFFGPVKYSILPELVEDSRLVEANALIEMGTFIAILLGTILGGILISYSNLYIAVAIISISVLGVLFSRFLRPLSTSDSKVKIDWTLFKPTLDIIKITRNNKDIFNSVLVISWFWFLGAALLSMFPGYVKNVINGNEHIVTLFLALFSIGVAVGSILCEKISKDKVELGMIPYSGVFMSLFLMDIYFQTQITSVQLKNIALLDYLYEIKNYRVLFDLFGLSVASGFFTVPLYTFIQRKSLKNERSRIIAGLNIFNAFFMVLSAIFLTILYMSNLGVGDIFLVLSIMNIFVCLWFYFKYSEYLISFFMFVASKLLYSVKIKGLENIPKEGGAVLICNHASFVDWLIISGRVRRPIRYIMHKSYFKIFGLGWFFKGAKAIPISSKKESINALEIAMNKVSQELINGEIVCIFPEGIVTRNGRLDGFRPGIEKIIEKTPVPVIPMTLRGFWGSFFSRKFNGKGLSNPKALLTEFRRSISLDIYQQWIPENVTANKLERFVRSKLE